MPVMAGTGDPSSATMRGSSSRAAAATFATVLASSPMTTSKVRSCAHSVVVLPRDQRGSS